MGQAIRGISETALQLLLPMLLTLTIAVAPTP